MKTPNAITNTVNAVSSPRLVASMHRRRASADIDRRPTRRRRHRRRGGARWWRGRRWGTTAPGDVRSWPTKARCTRPSATAPNSLASRTSAGLSLSCSSSGVNRRLSLQHASHQLVRPHRVARATGLAVHDALQLPASTSRVNHAHWRDRLGHPRAACMKAVRNCTTMSQRKQTRPPSSIRTRRRPSASCEREPAPQTAEIITSGACVPQRHPSRGRGLRARPVCCIILSRSCAAPP